MLPAILASQSTSKMTLTKLPPRAKRAIKQMPLEEEVVPREKASRRVASKSPSSLASKQRKVKTKKASSSNNLLRPLRLVGVEVASREGAVLVHLVLPIITNTIIMESNKLKSMMNLKSSLTLRSAKSTTRRSLVVHLSAQTLASTREVQPNLIPRMEFQQLLEEEEVELLSKEHTSLLMNPLSHKRILVRSNLSLLKQRNHLSRSRKSPIFNKQLRNPPQR